MRPISEKSGSLATKSYIWSAAMTLDCIVIEVAVKDGETASLSEHACATKIHKVATNLNNRFASLTEALL